MKLRPVFNVFLSALGAHLALSALAFSAEAPLNTLNGTWGGDGSLAFDDGP